MEAFQHQDAGLFYCRMRVQQDAAVRLRSILEAYDGLAGWHATGDGFITIFTPLSQKDELLAVLEGIALTPANHCNHTAYAEVPESS